MQNHYYNPNVVEIDLLDLGKVLLSKIKWLIAAMVVGLIAGLLFAQMSKPEAATPLTKDEQIASLKKSMTETDIKEVEGLYQTYVSLSERIEDLKQRYEAGSCLSQYEINAVGHFVYSIQSSIAGIKDAFSYIVLSDEDYANLSDILFGDNSHSKEVYDLVSFEASPSQNDEKDSKDSNEIIIFVVAGDNVDKVSEAADYIDKRINNEVEAIKKIDDSAQLFNIGSQILKDTSSIRGTFSKRQDSLAKDLYNMEKRLNELNLNYIVKLTGDKKTYYSVISNKEQERIADVSSSSGGYKKTGLIGLLLGFFVACGYFAIKYISDGTVKTASELKWIINGDEPYNICQSDERLPFIKPANTSTDLVAEDMAIKLQVNNQKQLFVFVNRNYMKDPKLNEVVKKMETQLKGNVYVGNPLRFPEDLQRLSESDTVVLAVKLKVDKTADIKAAEQYCRNANVPISGIIII